VLELAFLCFVLLHNSAGTKGTNHFTGVQLCSMYSINFIANFARINQRICFAKEIFFDLVLINYFNHLNAETKIQRHE
jgi:hypothetical protein